MKKNSWFSMILVMALSFIAIVLWRGGFGSPVTNIPLSVPLSGEIDWWNLPVITPRWADTVLLIQGIVVLALIYFYRGRSSPLAMENRHHLASVEFFAIWFIGLIFGLVPALMEIGLWTLYAVSALVYIIPYFMSSISVSLGQFTIMEVEQQLPTLNERLGMATMEQRMYSCFLAGFYWDTAMGFGTGLTVFILFLPPVIMFLVLWQVARRLAPVPTT